ncbi:MAG: cob(I)yrinic acid a,c-diamide adenosyltransferase [Dehalococcoidia bacterium SM23_28_1]|nr:MAG: cob(I)yrinic acid a,c-diamide adenosyltransferase [Dehalococcoidia bacterium SM23_28_1]
MSARGARGQALVIVLTGHGKGKTTAALGVVLRAWGRDMKAVVLQFVKARTANYGENRAARKLGIEMIPMGEGFTWLSKDIEKDKATARECWELARQKIDSGQYDIVVLDEMTYPMTYGWIPVEEVIDTLRQRPQGLHVIITGRDAPQELIDFADLVTEMREVKHPYKKGVKARPGIDF